MKKSKTLKILGTVLLVALVCVVSIHGTLAYLKKTSNTVKNTFASATLVPPDPGPDGKENFRIEESKLTGDPGSYELSTTEKVAANNYTVIPGITLPKDPEVVVRNLQVEAYLFVEVVDELPSAGTITWAMAEGWTELTGATGKTHGGKVYVCTTTLSPSTAEQKKALIKDNELVVANTYDEATPESELKFVAYLAQTAGFSTALDAWNATFGA